jgi:glycerophosphoryl diester phosphodiesterase
MASMQFLFDLQGHRGARGLKPENTLPGFEVAFDLGVTSVETDVHLTHDWVPVLVHDPVVRAPLCERLPGSTSPDPATHPAVSLLTLEQLRGYRAAGNPAPRRFPRQDATVTPVARLFAGRHGLDPFVPPTVAEVFLFAEAYAGELGVAAGKTDKQRAHARRLRFDLELKRVPFRPEVIGDRFDGTAPGLLEQRVAEVVRAAGRIGHTTVRSFDHRCVRAILALEPGLTAAVLVGDTAPVDPAALTRQADAHVYCPGVEFLDQAQVRHLHAEGIRVVPWTVNDPDDWGRLLDWGVDGITTDFPDQLAVLLQSRGVAY